MDSNQNTFERLKQSLTNAYDALKAFIMLSEDMEKEKRRIIREAVEAAELKKRERILSRIKNL